MVKVFKSSKMGVFSVTIYIVAILINNQSLLLIGHNVLQENNLGVEWYISAARMAMRCKFLATTHGEPMFGSQWNIVENTIPIQMSA